MKGLKIFGVILLTIIIFVSVILITVFGGWFNTWFTHTVERVDRKIEDRTSYDIRKKVEDTCRSMIASYKTDIATYQMYRESENAEKISWAEQAKMRANKTANTYNEYILKNSYVWEENIPQDIENKLQIIY